MHIYQPYFRSVFGRSAYGRRSSSKSVGKCLHQADKSERCNFTQLLHNNSSCVGVLWDQAWTALFKTRQTLVGSHIPALNFWGQVAARLKEPPSFWMRDPTELCGTSDFQSTSPDLWKIWFACGVSFIHLSFCWAVLVKKIDPHLMFTSIKRRKHVGGVSFAVIVMSVRHDETLPSQPSLLWATAVESPLMTSRKKSAGLLWVSQVYPFKWKLLLYTSCTEYVGVTKTSCSYQCLRSIPKLFVLDHDKPEHFKIKITMSHFSINT